jgi:hypothetical protein
VDWLKSHEFLAAWLALPLMVIVAITQALWGRESGKSASLGQVTLYFAFLMSIAGLLTPGVDTFGKSALYFLVSLLGIAIIRDISK